MKSLKDFISAKEQPIEEEIISMDILELEDEPLFEGSARSHPADPPPILVMKRKYIRQFSNKQRVAMYYVDKLDKYITIPYETSHWSGQNFLPTTEDVENVIEFLETIVENRSAKVLVFADGKSTEVEPNIAESILMIYSTLNEDNKQKISDMAIRSKEDFGKVVNFAHKHLN